VLDLRIPVGLRNCLQRYPTQKAKAEHEGVSILLTA
jgi:hypothetical protein